MSFRLFFFLPPPCLVQGLFVSLRVPTLSSQGRIRNFLHSWGQGGAGPSCLQVFPDVTCVLRPLWLPNSVAIRVGSRSRSPDPVPRLVHLSPPAVHWRCGMCTDQQRRPFGRPRPIHRNSILGLLSLLHGRGSSEGRRSRPLFGFIRFHWQVSSC